MGQDLGQVKCLYYRVIIGSDNGILPVQHQAITWTNADLSLTLKHWETHGCVVSTAATDALVLKHQVITILNAD